LTRPDGPVLSGPVGDNRSTCRGELSRLDRASSPWSSRIRSDVEHDVNRKAELEVAHLHEKVDRLSADVIQRLDVIEKALGDGRGARRA
jgi:hypothetical protein